MIAGLSASPKRIPPKYFYDNEGSRLFEEITRTPEYYPTRSENEILRMQAGAIVQYFPTGAALVEFGSGACIKVRFLLDAANKLKAYVPVDISGEFLAIEAQRLRQDYPKLAILPVVADFMAPFALPEAVAELPKIGFFPGSTIGNFEPHEACAFLRHAGEILGPGAVMVVGVDLVKDPAVLKAAYNDAAGRDREIQSQPAAAHQPRTGRQLQARCLRTSRLLQSREQAGSRCIWRAGSARR